MILKNLLLLIMATINNSWVFYIIKNQHYTYAGVSPKPFKRLRQHNGEIKGGAKYTTSKGPGWQHICIVEGFDNKIQAMQFEWAVKHEPPRNSGGIYSRLRKLIAVCNKDKWTSNSQNAIDIPLIINWIDKPIDISYSFTGNITETYNEFL